MKSFPVSRLLFVTSILIVSSMLAACMMPPPAEGPAAPAAAPTAESVSSPTGKEVAAEPAAPEAVEAQPQPTQPAPAAPPSLESTPWKLESLMTSEGKVVPMLADTQITAYFENGQLAGNAGCNDYSAAYKTEGSASKIPSLSGLQIGPAAATQKYCADPAGIMDQEMRYYQLLAMVSSYLLDGTTLTLTDNDDAAILTYTTVQEYGAAETAGAAPQVTEGLAAALPLTGRTWRATFYNNGKEAFVSVISGTEITALFSEDGMVSGSAGCNSYSAGYTTEGDTISIGPAATTRMMCVEPEGVMEQEAAYLAALSSAVTYRIQGKSLELLNADGLRMVTYIPKVDLSAAVMYALLNMEYESEFTKSGTAPLTYGEYREPAAPDSATETVVRLTDHVAIGELTGQLAIAVVLVTDPGGSGTFYDLAVVMNQDGELVNVATTSLGDRVVINSITIQDNQIAVDMITHGPEDPMCCPTQAVVKTYALEGDQLVETSGQATSFVPSPVPGTELAGTAWRWQDSALSDGSTIKPADPAMYTVEFLADGAVSVQADCNSGSGTYKVEGSALSIQITAMTRAACASRPESLSDQYIEQLNSAASYAIQESDLIINLADESGNMRFSPVEVAAAPAGPPLPMVTAEGAQGVAKDVQVQEMPAAPYDESSPPGPTGSPMHVVVLLDGQEAISVLPVDDYVAVWEAAGNPTIAATIEQLKTMLAERPQSPQAPLPILPPPSAYNDVAAQVNYLDFTDGSGIAFVGRVAQDASPILNYQLRYYFQGLTADGKYYVSVQYPVRTSALPDDIEAMPEEQKKLAEEDFEAYLKKTVESLNALAPADFEPDLAALDALVGSIAVQEPDMEAAQAPAPAPTPAGEAANQLVGPTWMWFGTAYSNDTMAAPEDPSQYTLDFLADGQVLIKADCNSAAGKYTASDGSLKIELGPATLAECGPESLYDEYVRDLSGAAAYSLQEDSLFIDIVADTGTMMFAPVK